MIGRDNKSRLKSNKSKRLIAKFKKCKLCDKSISYVDFLDVGLLREFQSESGKILSKKSTGTCNKHQKMISNSIKRARIIGLIL